jgi:hypothetical protein
MLAAGHIEFFEKRNSVFFESLLVQIIPNAVVCNPGLLQISLISANVLIRSFKCYIE